MKSSIRNKNKHVLRMLILIVGACLVMLTVGSSTHAASCINLADIPLDTMEQAAPGIIMFVLDDSGSMDWSIMTPPTAGDGGLFDGMEYVFSDPGDDVYGWRENIEDFDTHRMMWMSQWSGYNGMYYNPESEYTPWPTLGNANIDSPRSYPTIAGNTLDMTAVWHELGVVDDAEGAPRFVTTGNWGSSSSADDYGTSYWYTTAFDDGLGNTNALQNRTATWTEDSLDPAVNYDVYAHWANNHAARLPDVAYNTYDAAVVLGSELDVNTYSQQEVLASDEWRQIAFNVNFPSGTGIVQINRDALQSQLSADAVKFVPVNTTGQIMRRHYYVQNSSGTYLVNLRNGGFEYYQVNLVDSADNRETVTLGKLAPLSVAEATTAGIVTGRSYTAECQNFANWYSFYRKRELTAKNAIAKSISTMDGVYVGILSINERITQRALPVRVNLDGVLQDDSSTLLTALYDLSLVSNGTPLRQGLKNAGEYFRGNYIKPATFHSHTSSATYPFFLADKGGTCQQAFTIIFTDGFYNGSDPGVGDADSNNSSAFDGPPFADGTGETLADVAMWYFETDLNTNLANDVPVTTVDPAPHQHMVTFSIAFGVTGALDTTLYGNCPNGTCPDPWPPTNTDSGKIDDMFHAAINGRGQFIAANNNEELVAALEALGQDIDSRLGSAAALATNSINLQVGSVIYQGTYNTANWYGEVSALPLNLTNGAVGTPIWRASNNVPAWDARNILSFDGTKGIVFNDANLTTTQVTQLEAGGYGTAAEIVNFIRGDTSNNVDNGGTLRNRNHPLGDVVHSAPTYYEGMVYIGANDGMLHGINAATGEELFAYVPNLVYDHLADLAFQGYSHQYYVDGTATVVKVGARDVLVCGLNKGGKGYFALDVADPTAMDATDVLWEYSAAGDDDLGYTFSRAFIVNTEAAGKVVVFGNGYDSVNGSAVLYVLDPVTGSVIKKFDTKVGGCNGLATPSAVDVELNGNVDYVFAGDLKGNMWKFDLRGASVGDWKFSYQDGASPAPLVSVRNANGDIQPITSPPEVMLDCVTTGDVRGLMVIFGTGQYLNTNDLTNVPEQSYYGIWDWGPLWEDANDFDTAKTKYLGTFEADRSLSNMGSGITLLEQVFEIQGAIWWALTDYQPVWNDEINGSGGTHMGWYWNMPVANERNIRTPMLRGGHAVLISTVPSPSPCDAGGISYINIVNACTGGRPYLPQFDVNGDGKIDSNDKILGPTGNPEPPSRKVIPKILFDPLEVDGQLYTPDSQGDIDNLDVVPIKSGMFFWRVIGQ